MEKGDLFCLGLIIGGVMGVVISFYTMSDDPTPMDVYQGKTTLEYVVVDGQATDSTVIWKDGIYNCEK